ETPAFLSDLPQKEYAALWQGQEGTVVLRSVGDILIHSEVAEMANTSSNFFLDSASNLSAIAALNEQNQINAGSDVDNIDLGVDEYNFDPMIARIAPYTSYADITVANLEIPAAYPTLPISTYPNFNMPSSILGSLRRAGIDAVSFATNHTLDQFAEGAYTTMDYLDQAGIMYYGAYASQDDKNSPRILDTNGIKLGFLAYTYGTNGMMPPEDEPWVVNYAYLQDMLDDVEALKDQVDAVVVSLHLGTEYGTLPDGEQIAITQALADAGVKLIIGGHPHDVQPVNWLNDGDTYVMYSQASFMTGQVEDANKVAGIHEVTFERDANGEVNVVDPKFMPTYFAGTYNKFMYESQPLAMYKDNGDGLASWFSDLKTRMHTYTDEFTYADYLETAWTEQVVE
ncbi:MAG: hypothetical protein B7Z25_04135, partial [Aerococcus viridans]